MVYVMLADGFEEIEALTVVDVLRRADIDVFTVSITDNKTVTGSHGIPVIADKLIDDADLINADMVILPGGMPGTEGLYNSSMLEKAIGERVEQNRGWPQFAPPMVLGKRVI